MCAVTAPASVASKIFRVFGAIAFLSASAAGAEDLHPIVETRSGYLLGASSGGKWIKAAAAAKKLKAGTSFRLYGLTSEAGKAEGREVRADQEVCPETQVVSLSKTPKGAVIALAAPWNALPRPVRIADTTQAVYRAAVRDFLTGRGLKNSEVKITQILRVDLDGNGEDEVLINATNYFSKEESAPTESPPAGSYSFVLLRRLHAGKVHTQLVAGEFYPTAKTFNPLNVYRIAAILDLNGDGKMELVVTSDYYEGGTTTVYQCTPAKIEEVLSAACGV
jgi:hypothetical protein